jgi:hypothetical protein
LNVKELRKFIKQFPDDMLVTTTESHDGYLELVDGTVREVDSCRYYFDTPYHGDFVDSEESIYNFDNEDPDNWLNEKYEKDYGKKFDRNVDVKRLNILVLLTRYYSERYDELDDSEVEFNKIKGMK